MSKQFKILVADDSVSILNSLQEMLASNSAGAYHVLVANNGREACTIAYHEKPDIILIDISMPVMSGIDAIKKIKGNPLIKDIPIVVMSSTRQFHDAFAAGADDFLLKPFNQYEMLMRIQLNLKIAEKGIKIKEQNDLLKTQKQEAINQRDIILRQKAELVDDLHYARFVQKAILPSDLILNDVFDGYFIYNQPKNVVSGDFYWIAQKNGLVVLAVGDCTGHGMSGALMTMAGAAFLNEILSVSAQFTADQILTDLRKKVIQLLNQRGDIGEASNGMDIAVCIYDKTNGTVQFSGANNPFYLVRKGEPLEVTKGDRMPIGFYFANEEPFTKHDFKISKGDLVYMFSDGYPDQFGGPFGKKFRYNQFRDLLTNAAELSSMDEQLELLKSTMDSWIEGYEQLDDMLVMGIRF
jgi:phosphoserine phosphatase RsbU/P